MYYYKYMLKFHKIFIWDISCCVEGEANENEFMNEYYKIYLVWMNKLKSKYYGGESMHVL